MRLLPLVVLLSCCCAASAQAVPGNSTGMTELTVPETTPKTHVVAEGSTVNLLCMNNQGDRLVYWVVNNKLLLPDVLPGNMANPAANGLRFQAVYNNGTVDSYRCYYSDSYFYNGDYYPLYDVLTSPVEVQVTESSQPVAPLPPARPEVVALSYDQAQGVLELDWSQITGLDYTLSIVSQSDNTLLQQLDIATDCQGHVRLHGLTAQAGLPIVELSACSDELCQQTTPILLNGSVDIVEHVFTGQNDFRVPVLSSRENIDNSYYLLFNQARNRRLAGKAAGESLPSPVDFLQRLLYPSLDDGVLTLQALSEMSARFFQNGWAGIQIKRFMPAGQGGAPFDRITSEYLTQHRIRMQGATPPASVSYCDISPGTASVSAVEDMVSTTRALPVSASGQPLSVSTDALTSIVSGFSETPSVQLPSGRIFTPFATPGSSPGATDTVMTTGSSPGGQPGDGNIPAVVVPIVVPIITIGAVTTLGTVVVVYCYVRSRSDHGSYRTGEVGVPMEPL